MGRGGCRRRGREGIAAQDPCEADGFGDHSWILDWLGFRDLRQFPRFGFGRKKKRKRKGDGEEVGAAGAAKCAAVGVAEDEFSEASDSEISQIM